MGPVAINDNKPLLEFLVENFPGACQVDILVSFTREQTGQAVSGQAPRQPSEH